MDREAFQRDKQTHPEPLRPAQQDWWDISYFDLFCCFSPYTFEQILRTWLKKSPEFNKKQEWFNAWRVSFFYQHHKGMMFAYRILSTIFLPSIPLKGDVECRASHGWYT